MNGKHTSIPVKHDRFIDEVRRIILEFLQGFQVRVYLFGSRTTETYRRTSDCDVAIDARDALPPGVLSSVREKLEESTVPYRVEIVDLLDSSAEFARRVREEGTVWYDSMTE